MVRHLLILPRYAPSLTLPHLPPLPTSPARNPLPLRRRRAHAPAVAAVRRRAARGVALVVGQHKHRLGASGVAVDGRCGREVVLSRRRHEGQLVALDGLVLRRAGEARAAR